MWNFFGKSFCAGTSCAWTEIICNHKLQESCTWVHDMLLIISGSLRQIRQIDPESEWSTEHLSHIANEMEIKAITIDLSQNCLFGRIMLDICALLVILLDHTASVDTLQFCLNHSTTSLYLRPWAADQRRNWSRTTWSLQKQTTKIYVVKSTFLGHQSYHSSSNKKNSCKFAANNGLVKAFNKKKLSDF